MPQKSDESRQQNRDAPQQESLPLSPPQTPSPAVKTSEAEADDEPRILDAVQDNRGGRWIRFGTENGSGWVGIADLQINEREVYRQLGDHGVILLTTGSRNALKAQIEAHKQYRPAVVASQPGWIAGTHIYVFGDGTHFAPSGSPSPEVIVTFEQNAKFTPRGSLTGWQKGVDPIVGEQPMLIFAISYGFLGPVLSFAPSGFSNPQAELVGPKEGGKSTALALAASVSAGDPTSDTGGAESWNLTLHSIDPAKRAHAHGLLGLDEFNLAGSSKADQQTVGRAVVFRVASTGSRKRLTDTMAAPQVKVAMLSTSNLPLAKLLNVDQEILEAIECRMITVTIPKSHPYGVLVMVPKGFGNSRQAIEHLRAVVDKQYGTAIREFVRRLSETATRDEDALRETISKKVVSYAERIEVAANRISKRVLKTLALAAVAGWLARKWGIVSEDWLHPIRAILQLVRAGQIRGVTARALSALARVRTYAKKNAKCLIKVAALKRPLTQERFEATAGFLRERNGATELLIPSATARKLSNVAQVMKQLKKKGRLMTEGGKRPKLTIKTPKSICATGRVYCIRIS